MEAPVMRVHHGWTTEWKPSLCKVDGFVEYRLERQTGPCLRDDYEFAVGADGRPLAFRNYQEAKAAIRE